MAERPKGGEIIAIHIDVVPDLDRRSIRNAAGDMQREFRKAGDDSARNISAGFEHEMPKVQKAIDKATAASGKLIVETEKLNALKSKSSTSNEQLVRQSERVATAYRNEGSAIREIHSALNTLKGGAQAAAQATQAVTPAVDASVTSFQQLGQVIAAIGRVGTPVAIAGMGAALIEVGGIAAAASQSLALIPGAVAGAASAFGTLKLATLGFGDAIESIGDPEKFAEAIGQLAPNAQQAALSIRNLMPAFTMLKNATQDSLFAGVGEQLNNLTNGLMPVIQRTTTGIAGAFNQMFMGVTNQLMTPETTAALQNISTNLVTAFQNLAPAVAPLTKAFADITSVGTDFLPELARAAADAANQFSQFIDEARQSGQLKEFMQQGLDVLKTLAPMAGDLAKAFLSLAPVGREILPQIASILHDIEPVMPQLLATALLIGPQFGMWADGIGKVNQAFGLIESVGIPIINKVGPAIQNALAPLSPLLSIAQKLGIIDEFQPIPVPGQSTLGGTAGGSAAINRTSRQPAAGTPYPSGGFNVPQDYSRPLGGGLGQNPNVATVTAGGLPILGKGGAAGGGTSDSARRDEIRAGLDPNQFAVDPFGGMNPGGMNVGGTTGVPLIQNPDGTWTSPNPAWAHLIQRESSGINQRQGITDVNSGGNEAEGLFQITPQTWAGAGGTEFAQSAIQASPQQQAMIAARIFQRNPSGSDWGAGLPGRENPAELAQGLQSGAGQLQYGTGGDPYAQPGLGYYNVDQQQVTESQQKVQSEAWDVQQAQMDLEVLKRDSLATQEERTAAERKLVEEGWQLQNAQVDLNKAMQGTWKDVSSTTSGLSGSMDQLGAAIDADFGLGQGLPGLVNNLVKSIANVAAAPMLGQLAGMQQLAAASGQPQGGFGAMGVMGAQNMMSGLSPILGNPAGYPGSSAMGPAALRGGGYPGDAALLANVPSGQYTQTQGADLTQGLADCSSAVEDLVNLMDGNPTQGRSMATGNAADWLTSHGFMPGSAPGAFNVGFNSGHMQATLPGGTPFNWGSDASAARGGVGGTGAFDPAFTSHFYRPVDGGVTPAGAPMMNPQTGLGPAPGPTLGGPLAMPGMGGGESAPLMQAQPSMVGQGLNTAPSSMIQGAQSGGAPGAQGNGMTGVSAVSALGSAAGAMMPGIGQAVQTGTQLANRTIGFMGQLGAIGAEGLMETFMLSGGIDPLKTLPGRLLSGIAGGKPATPNQAGQTQQPQGPTTGGDPNKTSHAGGPSAPLMNVENMHVGSKDDGRKVGQDAARQFKGQEASGWWPSR